MNGISITIEGEEAVFIWKDGKVYSEGYDLESERMALALTGLGKGVGVLLVAMNDYCRDEKEFISEVKRFISRHEEIISDNYGSWPEGQLLFEYFSYSSNPEIRWSGLESARLSEQHYRRLSRETEMEIKERMARLPQLPEKYFHLLANFSSFAVNFGLAYNNNCPGGLLKVFASDNDAEVRMQVARNSASPKEVLELLARDDDSEVRKYLTYNSKCPAGILAILARDLDEEVRLSAKERLAKSRDLEV